MQQLTPDHWQLTTDLNKNSNCTTCDLFAQSSFIYLQLSFVSRQLDLAIQLKTAVAHRDSY